MHFNPHSIPPIILMTIVISIGIYVLLHNPRSRLNIYLFLICLTVAFWHSFYITYNLDIQNPIVDLYIKICYCMINFIPITMLAFIGAYFKLNWKIWNVFNIIYGSIITLLILNTPYIVDGLHFYPWGHYPKAGKYHPLYLIYFVYMLSSFHFILFRNIYIKPIKDPIKLNQCKYMLTAFIFLIIGVIDYIPNYGIKLYPTGHFFGTFFISVIAYTIIKHKLLDIQIMFRKSLVYSFLITCITTLYLISILIFEQIFHNVIGYKNIAWSTFTTISIALIFIPLKNKIQSFIDKLFFRRTIFEIETENTLLKQEIAQTERLKSVAILASGMAHEIKNPLTALKTISEYLPKKGSDPEFLKKFAPIMAQEVDRIDNLVHELLEFAKPAPVQLKAINIHQLLNNTLDVFNNDFIKHKIKLTKRYQPPQDLTLNLDANQFKQALLNIILNAIDAMPNSGELTITTDSDESNNSILIKIQDTGTGIAKEDLDHIFDPFFTKKDKGTGLGLSITHEIIKNHNGKIFVESNSGKGTTFIIELPYNSPL